MQSPKYSVVIPTYNHCEDLLKPCVDSIIKHSDMTSIELVISANGCTDNTAAYLTYLDTSIPNLKIVWNDEALGYSKATNEGIKVASADHIVLLNNDTILLNQPQNQWLEFLKAPFEANSRCGISSIVKIHSEAANHDFAIFFCVMVSRDVFDKVGLLNEEYGVGGSEDTEFCIEAERAGFEVCEVLGKVWGDNLFTGHFPIYHKAEGTVKDQNLVTEWDSKFLLNELRLAKKYNPEWYKWRLSNNYERAVFLKGDAVFPRETQRYEWAAKNIKGDKVLEIGCSTGYGSQFFNGIDYTGLDYDPIIVEVAKEQGWGGAFVNADINSYAFDSYDTIIAFEVVEHLDNGLEIVEKLKKHCKRLLITVPHNEPKGFWGEHHKLHGLTEADFNGFQFSYINEHGVISETIEPVSESNRCNLMIGRWDA